MKNLDMKMFKQYIMDSFKRKHLRLLYAKREVIPGKNIPELYYQSIGAGGESSIFLGLLDDCKYRKGFVGEYAEHDGNYLLVGTNGSGKSRYLIKPTLETYSDPMVVLDFKGELMEHYAAALERGEVKRPFIAWGKRGGRTCYEAFALVKTDPERKRDHMVEIACALIPKPPDTREGYWIDMARNLLTAILIFGYDNDFNFVETIVMTQSKSVFELCKIIKESKNDDAEYYIRDLPGLKAEQLASIATEMRRHIVHIVTDSDICDALGGNEDRESFSWEEISTNTDAPHIFLELAQNKLEQWGCVVRLLLTQLIRTLERRPEKYTWEGKCMKPILILLDEFPLLGKIEVIMNSLTTLRSKKVHFYLAIQSISQLDYLYGKNGRAIIVDNCQFKILLNITEPDSQAYFSRMIGKVPSVQFGTSYSSLDESREATLAMQQQETRENLIWPEEFATNRDIWLHTPYGFFSTIKLPVSDVRCSESEIIMKLEQYKRDNLYFWRMCNGS